jgi:hypothetical protein
MTIQLSHSQQILISFSKMLKCEHDV